MSIVSSIQISISISLGLSLSLSIICYIQDQDHVHNIHCIQDHVHSILYTNKHQHQPWAQPLAFHNSYIPVHGTQSSQGVQVHTHHIHHREGRGQQQPWAQLQPHAFHNM